MTAEERYNALQGLAIEHALREQGSPDEEFCATCPHCIGEAARARIGTPCEVCGTEITQQLVWSHKAGVCVSCAATYRPGGHRPAVIPLEDLKQREKGVQSDDESVGYRFIRC